MILPKKLSYSSLLQIESFPQAEANLLRFGPFNSTTQKRWRKPIISAQTRLEDRTRDLKLDKHMGQFKRLQTALDIYSLITKRRGPFVSVQLMSRWKKIIGLNVNTGVFIRKYPRIFYMFTHPIKRNKCCTITKEMKNLVAEEVDAIRECELENVRHLKKIIMMSKTGVIHIHALRLIRFEMGLPEDFRDSILGKYMKEFKLVDLETVSLFERDESLGIAEIEKWREKEYTEKWLSEFETKYAFPINFPTGFKVERGFREKLKNWQRLPYVKPYERTDFMRMRTNGGIERFEKHAVGILHEFLNLMVEKRIEVERLSHFRKDFGIEVNIRELLLKHPGIFYISTKGKSPTVFLREAYCKGCLIEPNPIYVVRRKMLDLLLLGCQNTRESQDQSEICKEGTENLVHNEACVVGTKDGGWVLPILESYDEINSGIGDCDLSEEELNRYYKN